MIKVLQRPVECAQFTSDAFTGVLKREGVTISMDGRGRAFDLHFCRAALAQRKIRGNLPEGARHPDRVAGRLEGFVQAI